MELWTQWRRGDDPACEHNRVARTAASATAFVQRRAVCMDCGAMRGAMVGRIGEETVDTPDIGRWNEETQEVEDADQPSYYEMNTRERLRAIETGREWWKLRDEHPELVPVLASKPPLITQLQYNEAADYMKDELGRRLRRLHGEDVGGSGNQHYNRWFGGKDGT